jgi:AcrR family transcriptional regulator
MADEMSTTQRRPGGRTARVRQQVLDATAQILTEQGVEAVTVPAVAARSGVHHTTIYRSWSDRRALIEAMVAGVVDTSARLPDTGTLRGDLTELLEDILTLFRSPFGQILVALMRSYDESLARLPQIHWRTRAQHCAAILARARARGELTADADPRLVLDLLTGPNFRRMHLTRETLDDIDVGTTVDIVAGGLAHLRNF